MNKQNKKSTKCNRNGKNDKSNSNISTICRSNRASSDSVEFVSASVLRLDNEKKIPRKKIINNHEVPNNVNKSAKAFSQIEKCPEYVAKIEVTKHSPSSVETNNMYMSVEQKKTNRISLSKTRSKKRLINEIRSKENFVKNKRPYLDKCKPHRKIEGFENRERLFIRLVRIDISAKLKELKENDNQSIICISDSNSDSTKADEFQKHPLILVKPELLPKLEQPTTKLLKTELIRKRLVHINTTESLKIERQLLEKFKKVKENQVEDNLSGNRTDTLTPYVYEKTNKSVYETYQRTEDENGQMKLRCLLCPFSGERFKQMSLHYKFKHRDTPIEEMHFCDIKGCNFKAVHKGMFKWHMRRHMLAGDKIMSDVYPCDQCNKVFDQRKGFLIHLKHMHRDDTEPAKKAAFPCSTCNFTTTSKPNLQAHIYRKHVPNTIKPNFKCNICGYETHYKDSFKKHLSRVHLQIE